MYFTVKALEMEDHIYSKSLKSGEFDQLLSKKRKHDEIRQNHNRKRQKTRVNIGIAFTRRRVLFAKLCLKTDAEVACFLLDR